MRVFLAELDSRFLSKSTGLQLKSDPGRYIAWNAGLAERVQKLAANELTSATNVILFSAWKLFESILDTPGEYGFDDDDIAKVGGRIWFDDLHPATQVH